MKHEEFIKEHKDDFKQSFREKYLSFAQLMANVVYILFILGVWKLGELIWSLAKYIIG